MFLLILIRHWQTALIRYASTSPWSSCYRSAAHSLSISLSDWSLLKSIGRTPNGASGFGINPFVNKRCISPQTIRPPQDSAALQSFSGSRRSAGPPRVQSHSEVRVLLLIAMKAKTRSQNRAPVKFPNFSAVLCHLLLHSPSKIELLVKELSPKFGLKTYRHFPLRCCKKRTPLLSWPDNTGAEMWQPLQCICFSLLSIDLELLVLPWH